MYNISRFLGGLLLFILLSRLGSFWTGADNIGWLCLTVIIILVVWFFLEGTNYLLKKRACRPIHGLCWLVITAVIYIGSMGKLFSLYEKFYWWDKLAHFVGGAAVASFFFSLAWNCCRFKRVKIKALWISFFSLTTAAFFGTLLEIAEYDLLQFHRFGDYGDTISDLEMDVLGGLIVAMIVYFYNRKKKNLKNP